MTVAHVPSLDNDVGPSPGLEPIAIVGASCRLPGQASNTQKLWEFLKAGKSAWSRTPEARFNQAGFHRPGGEIKSGSTNTDGGHFLEEDIAAFDAAFFGISPNEANAMDPQQRLLLEIAYESFENAGFALEQLSDSKTGVFVGQWSSDYHEILTRDMDYPPTYLITGTGAAISSNRISYAFNLKGPSFTLDTGCSASLVAVHQAVLSLRSGETDQCFVAGVNIILDPQHYTYQSKVKMFSNEGKSFPFDARANGYGRGEGCSGVVLMPLSLALSQGRPIRAIIRNSAVNQDGRTTGITVPSSTAQMAAIKKAYADAGLEMYADYVEAHGTGTKVGDPIEAKAISATLGINRSRDSPLPIGSVKGNVGHLESGAGVTGLLKAVLMLEHNTIPPQVNSEKPNPAIMLDKLNIRIPQTLENIPLNRISINSFGYGGTNAHVILDSAASLVPQLRKEEHLSNGVNGVNGHGHTNGVNGVNGLNGVNGTNGTNGTNGVHRHGRHRLFVLSGASEKSCQSAAAALADYLSSKAADGVDQDKLLHRLSHTLSCRSSFTHRTGFISSSLDDLVEQLTAASTQPIPAYSDRTSNRIAFVFSGQGAQYPQMAKELLDKWPVFTESLERASKCLVKNGSSWDLLEELSNPKETSRMELPEVAQPATTAIQMALIDTLRHLGVVPSLVAGHSSGEIAAAYCAGALSFEDAVTVSYHRGRLTGELLKELIDRPGAMLAVGASPETVADAIQELGEAQKGLTIACYNSPSSVTVSGDADAVEMLHLKMEERAIFNRKLRTGGAAYHSHQMRQIAESYAKVLENINASPVGPAVVMVSSLTGEEVGEKLLDKDYWVQNLVSPVRFSHAVAKMCETKSGRKRVDLVLELGPHLQLTGPVKQILKSLGTDANKIQCAGTLKRGEDAEARIFDALRFLYLQRFPVNFQLANNGSLANPAPLTDLPPYAFDHSRSYWHEGRVSRLFRQRNLLPHELLGNRSIESSTIEPRWRQYLALDEVSWLKGHQVQGEVVFPAAGFISMAIQAMKQDVVSKNKDAIIDKIRLRNVCIEKALVLESGKDDLELTLAFRPQTYSARKSSDIWQEFRIFTVTSADVWTEHCRGLIHAVLKGESQAANRPNLGPFETTSLPNEQSVSPKKFYYLAKDAGLDWANPFNGATEIRTAGNEAILNVSTAPVEDLSYGPQGPLYVMHPAIMDAALFQSISAILLLEEHVKTPFVPTFLKDLTISVQQPGSEPAKDLTCYASRIGQSLSFNVSIFEKGSKDKVVVDAHGLTVTGLPGLSISDPASREFIHSLDWVAYMPAVTQKWLQDVCRSQVQKDSMLEQRRRAESLALSYIKPALESVPEAEVPEGHLRYWRHWMKVQSAQEYDPELVSASISDQSVGARAMRRVGPHLGEVLKGAVHPLTLLNEDNLLAEIYADEGCLRCYAQIAAYCAELGRHNPNMKILEIGAGTASTTEPVLRSLQTPKRVLASKYVFTDISAGFFSAAQDRLADFQDVVEYKELNIENDPSSQGFELHDYDLVLATNVLHATSKIDETLKNVRSLLRPGGKLILMEVTEDMMHLNLVFGTLSGWWAGYDEGRTLSPLLTEEIWASKLAKQGFSNTKPQLYDYEPGQGGSQCVFIAEAVEESTQEQLAIDVVTSLSQDPRSTSFVEGLKSSLPGREISLKEPGSTPEGERISIVLQDVFRLVSQGKGFEDFRNRLLDSKVALFITSVATDSSESPDGDWTTGFCRSLRLEHPDVRLVTLRLQGELDSSKVNSIVTILQSPTLDSALLNADVDLEFLERDGQLYVPRVASVPVMDEYVHGALGNLEPTEAEFLGDRTLVVELGTPGLLETMRWTDDLNVKPSLDPDYIKLKLCSASVNFKEVLIATGQLEGITTMLNDCSGIVLEVGENMKDRYKPGDRVCGLDAKFYTNYPILHGDCCYHLPDDMDFDSGASIPVVWSTTYYSLVDCGKLQKGERILIHSGAGAVGQSSIMLARHIGAEIFVTCGNDEKKKVLMDNFGIPEDHIFSSRTTAFYDGIMAITGGEGIDVVLNSLGGDMLRESCNLLTHFGRFVEIGRKDLMDDALLPMEFMLKNITFSYVDLARVSATRQDFVQRLLRNSMALFAAKEVQPVMLTKMPISDISKAFRFIQTGKHVGKVVLTVEPGQKVKATRPRQQLPVLKPDATYVIAGGLGGLGKRIVSWLAERGARNIATLSRSGIVDADAQALVDKLALDGVKVVAKRCDVAEEASLKATLSELATEMPPVRGLIHSAMVLRDALFSKMTVEQWSAALAPKIAGTWNLHTLLPADIDFFLMLSSGVAITGNIGQCNYGGGCSFQDAMAHYRTGLGLAAHSINVGAIVDAGYVSENPQVAETLRHQGLGTVTVLDLLSHMDQVVDKQRVQSATGEQLPCQSMIGLIPSGDERGLRKGSWMNDKKFALVEQQNGMRNSGSDGVSDVGSTLSAATDPQAAVDIACRAIIEQLGKMIDLPSESISPTRSLNSYGVDSLMAMELGKWIGLFLKANIPLLSLTKTKSLTALAELVVKESKLVSSAAKPT